jgi:hypothetical protein
MLRVLVTVCLFAMLASMSVSAGASHSEVLQLASWLGALSMIAGAVSQQGPHWGL